MISRVKFYDVNDLSIGFYFPRIQEILDAYLSNSYSLNSFLEALEFYNIIKFIENEVFSIDWSLSYIEEIKKSLPSMIQLQNNYFGSAPKDEILNNIKLLQSEYNYREDFFEIFTLFNYGQKISEVEFVQYFIESNLHLCHLLKNTYFLKKYPTFIKQFFLSSPSHLEILLDNFVDSNSCKNVIPSNITNLEWNDLIEKYICDPDVNINYLKILRNPIKGFDKNRYFQLTDKQKLLIDKKIQEFNSSFNDKDFGIQVDIRVYTKKEAYYYAIKKSRELHIEGIEKGLYNPIAVATGGARPKQYEYTLSTFIDSAKLFEKHNFQNILDYFCKDFELSTSVGTFALASFPQLEMGALERTLGISTRNHYKFGFYFSVKHQLYVMKLIALSKILQKFSLRIEDFITWFFDIFLTNQYGIDWIHFDVPSISETTGNKTATLFRIEESLRKQYKLLSEEGLIDVNLYNITSTPSIESLQSFTKRKYFSMNNSDNNIQQIVNLLFSDQSPIHFINEEYKGSNFKELISQQCLSYVNFHEYQIDYIKLLIDAGICQNDTGVISFKDMSQISLLEKIFLYGSVNSISLSESEKLSADRMLDNGWLIFSDTLFSIQEINYLNFVLNNKSYDNSWGIRNKYLHGVPIYDSIQQYEYEYHLILLILIFYIIKINEELKHRSYC